MMSSDEKGREIVSVEQSVSETNEPAPGSAEERSDREASPMRRRLLRMGWTAPVILAVGLTQARTAFAQTTHEDHDDMGHQDFTDHDDFSDHIDV